MGTQQILMVVLVLIIIGVATIAGIFIFRQQAVNHNRTAIISDMNIISTMALSYYRTPEHLGGGNNLWELDPLLEWLNLNMNEEGNRILTKNGEIELEVSDNGHQLEFIGYGNEIGFDEEDAVKARLIYSDPYKLPELEILN